MEHDPLEIVRNARACMDVAMQNAAAALPGATPVAKGLGITNQRETAVAWDKSTGKALSPSPPSSLHPLLRRGSY